MPLKSSTQVRIMAPHLTHPSPREAQGLAAIMGVGDGAESAVHSHEVVGVERSGFLDLDGLQEEPLLTIAFEIGLSFGASEQGLAFLARLERKGYSHFQQA